MNDQGAQQLGAYLLGNAERVRDVTAMFSDGTEVSGFVKRLAFPTSLLPEIVLCRHSVQRGENPFVTLNFNDVVGVEVTLHDRTTKKF